MANILVVDDEAGIREMISDILNDQGYTVATASSAGRAIDLLTSGDFSAVILDIWLEGSDMDGMGVLKAVRSFSSQIPVIMISGHANIEVAVNAVKLGAYDFIEKPFKAERLIIMLEHALKVYDLQRENLLLKKSEDLGLIEIAGTSKQAQVLAKVAQNAAISNSRVIILGEDGTGKETLAKYIHLKSGRAGKGFVTFNAASLTAENFEEELNGRDYKLGALHRCKGGTLYIDELMDLVPQVQAKLLNVLHNNKFDVRFICGSSKDLLQATTDGTFNSSLYYRLNVVPISIAPLRARKEDVAELSVRFLEYYAKTMGVPSITLDASAVAALQVYGWPGNVRELRNVMEWLVIMKGREKSVMTADDLPVELLHGRSGRSSNDNAGAKDFTMSYKQACDSFARDYIKAHISKQSGNVSKAAEALGLNRTALHRKMKALRIK